jgi:alpha/beta superfamily hydrolase
MNSPQAVRFASDDSLHGVLHAPAEAPRRGFVICPPFGEESKCAYRTLYEMANLAAAGGCAALRFDYLGTGNSAGPFEDFSPSQARKDIGQATEYLRSHGIEKVGALGLGLGASLAFEAATKGEVDFLVMWQPLINGEEFYNLNIKRQLVRQMLTHGKAKGARSRGDLIDLDGYALRKTTVEETRKLDLLDLGLVAMPPTLIVQISYTQSMAADMQALADSCHPEPHTECIVCEPFWKRIGFVNCSAVYDRTLEWLERQV